MIGGTCDGTIRVAAMSGSDQAPVLSAIDSFPDEQGDIAQLALADLDQDGALDLAVMGASGELTIYWGDGAGHLGHQPSIQVFQTGSQFGVVRLSVGGAPELAVGTLSLVQRVTIDPQRKLATQTLAPIGGLPRAADLDRDGVPDLVVADPGTLHVLHARTQDDGAIATSAMTP